MIQFVLLLFYKITAGHMQLVPTALHLIQIPTYLTLMEFDLLDSN